MHFGNRVCEILAIVVSMHFGKFVSCARFVGNRGLRSGVFTEFKFCCSTTYRVQAFFQACSISVSASLNTRLVHGNRNAWDGTVRVAFPMNDNEL